MLKTFFLGAAVLFFLGAPVYAQGEIPTSSEPQQMEDFNLTGYGADGRKTWEVAGASMDMLDNEIKITDITARMFGDQENLVVTADRGNFDKETGVVRLIDNVRAVTDEGLKLTTEVLDWSQKDQIISTDEMVEVKRDNLTAVGRGLEAETGGKIARFEKDVILTIEQEGQAEEAAPAPPKALEEPFGGPGKLIITCDGSMQLNYDKQVAVFHDNVKVQTEGELGTLVADTMTVRFDAETREMDRIEANGNVQIHRGENISYSDGAIFTNAERKVVLTGRPRLVLFADSEDMSADAPIVQEGPGVTP